jgi:hypothetical protein
MKKIYNTLILILLFQVNSSFAERKEPARLCFYRSEKMLCNSLNFDLQLNNINVYTLKPAIKKNASLEYLMYSEGRLNITVKNWMNDWTSNTALQIVSGKTYYIKIDCSLSGISLSTNQVNGEKEWPLVSVSNLMSMSEDPNTPLIVNEKPEAEVTQVIVKTDTIKKTIYVNSYQVKKYTFEPSADVDANVPVCAEPLDTRFALIIGNEDYSNFQPDLKSEMNVDYARNDASAFREYAVKVLGVPEKNITLILDGTFGQISQAISKMNLIAKNTGGKAQLLFYYAGHGMPDEVTKEPYIIPVDISGANVTSGIRLKDIYSRLTEFPSEKVTVVMDACFSGGARGEGLIAGRGISIKPKDDLLKGNIVVFSSSSGDQSSLPYHDKKHGIYTYFLLKKLQETKGDISAKELALYLKEKVGIESVLINNKEQNPQARTSAEATEKWGKWKMNK